MLIQLYPIFLGVMLTAPPVVMSQLHAVSVVASSLSYIIINGLPEYTCTSTVTTSTWVGIASYMCTYFVVDSLRNPIRQIMLCHHLAAITSILLTFYIRGYYGLGILVTLTEVSTIFLNKLDRRDIDRRIMMLFVTSFFIFRIGMMGYIMWSGWAVFNDLIRILITGFFCLNTWWLTQIYKKIIVT